MRRLGSAANGRHGFAARFRFGRYRVPQPPLRCAGGASGQYSDWSDFIPAAAQDRI